MKQFNALLLGLGGLLVAGGAAPVLAQSGRDVMRLVSPFAAGGGREILARTFITELAQELGHPVIVDNRPGAGGNTGTIYVAKATPDGRTLLMTGTNHNIAPLSESPVPYSVKDFAAVATIGTGSNVLMVSSQLPVKSVQELISHAKAYPGKLNYGSAGTGSASHLTMAYFMGLAGIDMTHIPYKSGNAATTEMLAGRIDATFVTAAEVMGFVNEPRVRVLAVSSPKRVKFLPNIASIAESGVAKFAYESWWGLLAPAATPKAIINRINAAMVKTMQDPAVVERLAKLTIEPRIMTPEQFEAFLRSDIENARRLLRSAGSNIKE